MAECWMRYVSSYPAAGSAFEATSEARRKRLLANSVGMFADLASGGGTIDGRPLRNVNLPVTIVDAGLSPSFLRRSSHRLKQLLPQARQVTLQQSGHWVAVDAHDELIRILATESLSVTPGIVRPVRPSSS
jgi:pimeloyl-ACP methyl ester carboxylesterase